VIAGLALLAALASALWLAHQPRLHSIVPAIGLTLAFLVLAGLALATVRSLTAVPIALAAMAATLAATWASARGRVPAPAEPAGHRGPSALLALAGVLAFAALAAVAIRYAAASATADSNGASTLAVWAYPAGDQLHVGARQPAGHEAESLRIVVTEAGITRAAWNNVRLAPGQEWEAPALTITGSGPVRVVALHGRTVVASLSASVGR
jgi:hypothetical protein